MMEQVCFYGQAGLSSGLLKGTLEFNEFLFCGLINLIEVVDKRKKVSSCRPFDAMDALCMLAD